MIDFGTVRPGTTLYIPFATYSSDDPSASITLTGLVTTDIEVYKNGSTTQRASDSGYALLDTDGIDFDGTTGIHGISIDLSDNTTAGFWAAGAQYTVVIASVTVDAATINFIAATFRIGYADAMINTTIATLSSQTSFTLTDGPAEASALVGCPVVIHDVASAVQVGHGIITAYAATTKTVTLAAGTTFTAAASDNIAIYPPSNVRWAGSTLWSSGAITAGSIAANAITAAKIADSAIDNATFAADVGSTAYASNRMALAADKALVQQKLDHLVAVADSDDPVNNSIIAKMASNDGDWSTFTGDSQAPLLEIAGAISTQGSSISNIDSNLGSPTDFGSGTSTLAANLRDLADNGTAVFDRSTDSLQAIRDATLSVNMVQIDGSTSAATNQKNAALAMQTATVQTAAGDANTSSAFDTNLATENDDYYGSADGGLVIGFISGTAQQFQTRRVIASTTVSGNTRVTVEEAFDGTPSDSDTFVVLGRITELT